MAFAIAWLGLAEWLGASLLYLPFSRRRCIWRAVDRPARKYFRFLNPSSRHFSVSFSFRSLSRPCSFPRAIPARHFSSSLLGPIAKYQELVSAHTLIGPVWSCQPKELESVDDPGQAKVAQLLQVLKGNKTNIIVNQNLYEKLLAGSSGRLNSWL